MAWLDERGIGLAEVTEEDVTDYVAVLGPSGRAPASVKRALVAVRGLHRFLAEETEGLADPAADVEVPRCPAACPRR